MIYNLSIRLYVVLLNLLSPFHPKAKKWVEGRKNIFSNLSSTIGKRHQNQHLAWFHCASLGEFEQGRPVLEAFRKHFPQTKILLTFFSPSGYEVRKNYDGADYIFYLPADTPSNVATFLDIVKPSIVFFVKYEFWKNYLFTLHQQDIPCISFSAIFRPNQIFFKSYGQEYRKILNCFTHIFVQNQESLELLRSIGISQISLSGDTRFDRVKQIVEAQHTNTIAERFKQNRQIFIIGSAWQQDMDVLIPFINKHQNKADLAFIIAPHEIHPQQILDWTQQFIAPSIQYSEVNESTNLSDYQILIINNIGILSSLYQYADYAFIGGAFGKGLHNILEAATFGMPIFFGDKSYQKFKEAKDLLALEGAFSITDELTLGKLFHQIDSDTNKQEQISNITKQYVLKNTGSTEQILAFVKSIFHD